MAQAWDLCLESSLSLLLLHPPCHVSGPCQLSDPHGCNNIDQIRAHQIPTNPSIPAHYPPTLITLHAAPPAESFKSEQIGRQEDQKRSSQDLWPGIVGISAAVSGSCSLISVAKSLLVFFLLVSVASGSSPVSYSMSPGAIQNVFFPSPVKSNCYQRRRCICGTGSSPVSYKMSPGLIVTFAQEPKFALI